MNSDILFEEHPNKSPLIKAWARHYEAKGCSPQKAYAVASARAQRKATHP